MASEGDNSIRNDIVHINYNVLTGRPFSAMEMSANEVDGDQIMDFKEEIDNVRDELLGGFDGVVTKVSGSQFSSFGDVKTNESLKSDDWETIPEYADKLNQMKLQLDHRTQTKIQQLVKAARE